MKIFVASTFEDFRAERAIVVDALRELGLQPLNMEDFGASSRAPIEICKATVEAADAMVVLLGEVYGTLVPDEDRSFVHVEIRTALDLGLPILVYLRPGLPRMLPESWPAPYRDLVGDLLQTRTASEIGAPRLFFREVLRDLATLADARDPGATDWQAEALAEIAAGQFEAARRRLFFRSADTPGTAFRLLAYVELLDDRDGAGIADAVSMLARAAAEDDVRASHAVRAIAACSPGWL